MEKKGRKPGTSLSKATPLPKVWERGTGEAGLSHKQSLLNEAVFLLHRMGMIVTMSRDFSVKRPFGPGDGFAGGRILPATVRR